MWAYSYDTSTIESFNGLDKWELIYPYGPRQGIEDVEFTALENVDWFNHRRRHGEILPGRRQFTTAAAHEAAYYRHNVTADPAATKKTSLYGTRGDSYSARPSNTRPPTTVHRGAPLCSTRGWEDWGS